VNDGIARELSSVAYTSVDDVVKRVLELGEGAMMAKSDVKAAYRNVPAPPKGQVAAGHDVEGSDLCGWHSSFWAEVSPVIVHSSWGCNAMDCNKERCKVGETLHG